MKDARISSITGIHRRNAVCWAVLLSSLAVIGAIASGVGSHVSASAFARSGPAPATSSSPVLEAKAGGSASASLEKSVLSSVTQEGRFSPHDVFLPNFLDRSTTPEAFVHPLYPSSPAPMGIGDIGVRNTTGTAQPYTLNTTSWTASVTILNANSLYLDGADDVFTVQLNTVLANTTVYGNTTNDFWTQDVLGVSPLTDSVSFVDNIWNFSNSGATQPVSTFHPSPLENGSAEPYLWGDAGPGYTLPFPFVANLYINSSLTVSGGIAYPTVRFGYELGTLSGAELWGGVFDTVEFNSGTAVGSTPVPQFLVDGSQLTPVGLPYDSEIVFGGDGSGSNINFFGLNASSTLRYYNSTTHDYQNAPSALDAGVDTAETSDGIAEYYTTPGTMELGAGPSIVEPMWNETPGGNVGAQKLTGSITPANSFVFINPGSSLDRATAGWAPTETASSYSYTLPPGEYAGVAELSDYDPQPLLFSATPVSADDIALSQDPSQGIYTPLYAWDNSEYAALATSGAGTAASPYEIENTETAPLDPLFAQINDDWFPVFSGVFFTNSTVHVDLNNPPSFTVDYPPAVAVQMAEVGLPTTNELQFELYDVANVVVWGGSDITGWFGNTGHIFPLSPLEFPLVTMILWGATDSLIGDNTFVDQGVSILMLQGGGNVVWGNHIVPGLQTSSEDGYGEEIGISSFEPGDLIYDNYVTTTYEAYAPNGNFVTGAGQTNLDWWNLSGVEPATQVREVDGYALSGSIVDGYTQCGNYWGNYLSGTPLPFTDSGDIADGGDYCPLSLTTTTYPVDFVESGLPSTATWSVAVPPWTGSAAAGQPIIFALPNGTYNFTAGAVAGYESPDPVGYITVLGGASPTTIDYSQPTSTGSGGLYLAEFAETGLTAGTTWSVSFYGTTLSSNASVQVTEVKAGDYSFSVPNVAGYTVAPASGAITVGTSGGYQAVVFTPQPGTLAGSVVPAAANVWVDGAVVASSGGTFSLTLAPGVHSITASASGYAPYSNNVTVSPGTTTSITIQLSALQTTSAPAAASPALSSTDVAAIVGGLVFAGAAVLAAVFLWRRRRST